MDVDLALVGAGGAGLSVVLALDARLPPGRSGPSMVLIDPVEHAGDDRTWCFWDDGTGPLDPLVHRSWRHARLMDRAGRATLLDLRPLRYVMIRSRDVYARAEEAIARLGAVRIVAAADDVRDGAVRAGGQVVTARWILDSRPAPPQRPANTALLQHFRGWTVVTRRDAFDPDVPVLMDFGVPQPARGVAFGYVLPDGPRRALVEYTEFSRERLPGDGYDGALRAYLASRFGLGPADHTVENVEDGAIPMTDAVPQRRAGVTTFRLGTAGGATRASTGYTFAALQRQAAAVADALLTGREPLPPAAYPARHRWMDGVLLRALDRGLVPGPELFGRLFTGNPPERLLRFLDGATSLPEELRVMATAPMLPMARATAEDAVARLRRRVRPGTGRAPGPRTRPGAGR